MSSVLTDIPLVTGYISSGSQDPGQGAGIMMRCGRAPAMGNPARRPIVRGNFAPIVGHTITSAHFHAKTGPVTVSAAQIAGTAPTLQFNFITPDLSLDSMLTFGWLIYDTGLNWPGAAGASTAGVDYDIDPVEFGELVTGADRWITPAPITKLIKRIAAGTVSPTRAMRIQQVDDLATEGDNEWHGWLATDADARPFVRVISEPLEARPMATTSITADGTAGGFAGVDQKWSPSIR